jgi:hypothetical protein
MLTFLERAPSSDAQVHNGIDLLPQRKVYRHIGKKTATTAPRPHRLDSPSDMASIHNTKKFGGSLVYFLSGIDVGEKS